MTTINQRTKAAAVAGFQRLRQQLVAAQQDARASLEMLGHMRRKSKGTNGPGAWLDWYDELLEEQVQNIGRLEAELRDLSNREAEFYRWLARCDENSPMERVLEKFSTAELRERMQLAEREGLEFTWFYCKRILENRNITEERANGTV